MARELLDVVPQANDENCSIVDEEIEEVSIIIDVTKSNFWEQSNDFIKNVGNASFIAIDEEMSGIQLPPSMGTQLAKDETPEDRYPSFKRVSERYSIIQLGVCLFEKVAEPSSSSEQKSKFHVRRYKFTMFPPADASITREIILSPGSVKFLSEGNNCNLNEWIQDGIPFCTGEVAAQLLEKFRSDQLDREAQEASSNPSVSPLNRRRKVELTRHEDREFHAKAMASLREWLDAAILPNLSDPEGVSFLLPPCNAFLRRALFESIPSEYPNLVLETVRETSQIRVWRLNAEERKRRQQRLLREGFEKVICEKVGVWRVFLALSQACSGRVPQDQVEHMALAATVHEAMEPFDPSKTTYSRRNIPLVVHNGMQDLLFLMTHFHDDTLPDSWKECKRLINLHFPVIYDTKIMANEYLDKEIFRGRTYLSTVYEQTLLHSPQWNRVFYMNGQAELNEQLHDAGYDSYCTGASFHGLVSQINQQKEEEGENSGAEFNIWEYSPDDEEIAWHYGRNKLYFHLSPYTIDLESLNSDSLTNGMSQCSTYRVVGIDPSVSTRDIVRCLTGLTDSFGHPVNFEIVWVNDICFIVGAMLQSRDIARYREHGGIISNALRNRFRKGTVEPLVPTADQEDNFVPSLRNLWGLLSGGKRAQHDDRGGPQKRRRVE